MGATLQESYEQLLENRAIVNLTEIKKFCDIGSYAFLGREEINTTRKTEMISDKMYLDWEMFLRQALMVLNAHYAHMAINEQVRELPDYCDLAPPSKTS